MKKSNILSVVLGAVLGLGALSACTPTPPPGPVAGDGTANNPYTVEEAIAYMESSDYVEFTEIHVTGVATDVSFDSKHSSYTIYLDGTDFQIYSGQLASGVEVPAEGDTITASGLTKIFASGSRTVYEIAYDSSHKTSPSIYKVEKGAGTQAEVYTVEEAIQIMDDPSVWEEGMKLHVTGVVQSVEYNSDYGSYTIYIADNFQIYSGKVAADVNHYPEVGDTITASGLSKIYTKQSGEVVYEVAYMNGISPSIYAIEKAAGNPDNPPAGSGSGEGSGSGSGSNAGATGSYADCEHYYDFTTFAGTSVQYADNEVHELTDGLTVTLTDCHINKSLRMYKQDNSYGTYNGVLVSNAQSSAINAVLVTIGDKPDSGKTCTLNFYGSTDGTTWTQVGTGLTVEKNGSYTVDFSAANYTYFKIEAADYQTRITKLGVDLK